MADGQLLPSWNDGAAKSAILDFVAGRHWQGDACWPATPTGRASAAASSTTATRFWRRRPFLGGENPAQALQLAHVTKEGEQSQENDEVLIDFDLELRSLRDKHKPENRSWKHEDHAGQKQNCVPEQSVLEARQRHTNAIGDPIRDLHQCD
jgi:hypothetical protein